MTSLSKIAASLAAAFLATATPTEATSASSNEGSFERTLQVSGPVDLEVSTGSGSIRVHAGSSGVVRVEGRIRASSRLFDWDSAEDRIRRLEQNPPVEQTGNAVRIGWLREEDLRRNISISYDIWTPEASSVRARTGSGSLTIEGVEGPVDARTGSGSIRAARVEKTLDVAAGSGSIDVLEVRGNVKARTGSGSIRIDDARDGLTVSTGSGTIDVANVSGAIYVDTGSGGIRARRVRGSFDAHASSGGITVDGEPTGDWRLRSSSGGITVRIPDESAFDLKCRTSSGSVHTDFPITMQGTIRRKQIEGRVRGGGALLEATSSSGSIRILSRSGS